MELDNLQIKLVKLTMELDIKVQQFNELCNKLEKLKKMESISPNSIEYENILREFTMKYNEIIEIKNELKRIK